MLVYIRIHLMVKIRYICSYEFISKNPSRIIWAHQLVWKIQVNASLSWHRNKTCRKRNENYVSPKYFIWVLVHYDAPRRVKNYFLMSQQSHLHIVNKPWEMRIIKRRHILKHITRIFAIKYQTLNLFFSKCYSLPYLKYFFHTQSRKEVSKFHNSNWVTKRIPKDEISPLFQRWRGVEESKNFECLFFSSS